MATSGETGSTLALLFEDLLRAAPASSAVADQARLTHLTFGLVETDTAERRWIRIDEGAMAGGAGGADIRFAFEATAAAWRELAEGMPVNRLVRQGKVVISGDARSCVQNWLLMHHIFSATGKAR